MGIFIPLAVAGGLAKIGSSFLKGRKQEKFAKEQKAATEKAQRQEALSRALGGTNLITKPPIAPEAPSTAGLDVIGGLGELAALLSVQQLAGPATVPGATVPGATVPKLPIPKPIQTDFLRPKGGVGLA